MPDEINIPFWKQTPPEGDTAAQTPSPDTGDDPKPGDVVMVGGHERLVIFDPPRRIAVPARRIKVIGVSLLGDRFECVNVFLLHAFRDLEMTVITRVLLDPTSIQSPPVES